MNGGEKVLVWIVGTIVAGVSFSIAVGMYVEHLKFREAIEAGLHQQYVPGNVNPIWVPKEGKQ